MFRQLPANSCDKPENVDYCIAKPVSGNFFMNQLKLCMLSLASMCPNIMSLRLSPEGPHDIVSSIRARIVLPARNLVKAESQSCDSLTSGPRCLLFDGQDLSRSVSGVLEPAIWEKDESDIPDEVYVALSRYVQLNWRGSSNRYVHPSITTALSAMENGRMQFVPSPVETETQQFISSSGQTGWILQLNSIYSYISFISQSVSIVEFQIQAPQDTGVFARGYDDGIPRWFRYIRPGALQDIALSSLNEDPSIESVDYIEIVGKGAQVVSLILSVDPTSTSRETKPPLFFLDGDLEADAKQVRSRLFHSSAYLVDLDSAVKNNLKFKPRSEFISSAKDDKHFTYDHLAKCLKFTDGIRPDYPGKTIEDFIHSVDIYVQRYPESEFYETFTNRLVEAPPDLIAFLIRVPRKSEEPPEPTVSGIRWNTPMRFQSSRNNSTEMSSLLDSVLASLGTALGPHKLLEMVKMFKVNRFLRESHAHPDAEIDIVDQESIDEEILKDVILNVLNLPTLDDLPYGAQKEILVDAITMLVPPGSVTAVEIDALVDTLL